MILRLSVEYRPVVDERWDDQQVLQDRGPGQIQKYLENRQGQPQGWWGRTPLHRHQQQWDAASVQLSQIETKSWVQEYLKQTSTLIVYWTTRPTHNGHYIHSLTYMFSVRSPHFFRTCKIKL